MIAFVFPGQGSHRAGALAPWEGHPAMRVLRPISAGIGRDVLALTQDPTCGSRTADAQPAILAVSLVVHQALVDEGVVPETVAGHSLGEFTAAVAAGCLDVESGAALVAARGAAMARACVQNPGTMAAIVKLEPDHVRELVDSIEDLVIANDNAPGQVVVAGTPAAIDTVRASARDAGGRALPLDVEGAFHSPAMAPAVAEVQRALTDLDIADPTVTFVSGSTAAPLTSGEAVGRAFVDGILSPVRWREVQMYLRSLGVTHLIEVGPGGVLAGLAKRTVPDITSTKIETPEHLSAFLAEHGQPGDR